jgi:uncharacterized protein (TIGR02598 family)
MMVRHHTSKAGFSLIEVGIALGICAFCIVAIVGLLPVGMNSVRSVSNENNAIHIASSIEGIWQVAPTNSKITITNLITNLLVTNVAPSSVYSTNYYFNEFGEQVDSVGASVNMTYTVTNNAAPYTNAYTVNMTFAWPPSATKNYQTTREFSYTISK